jgi:hypothetical protein
VVEASSRGVVWGIGYDHTAWVYTGGYGGGCCQGEDTPDSAADGSSSRALPRCSLLTSRLPCPPPGLLSQYQHLANSC